MPYCFQRVCLVRWWLRYGVRFLIVVAVITVIGVMQGADPCRFGCRN
jgi:hypothetical protein